MRKTVKWVRPAAGSKMGFVWDGEPSAPAADEVSDNVPGASAAAVSFQPRLRPELPMVLGVSPRASIQSVSLQPRLRTKRETTQAPLVRTMLRRRAPTIQRAPDRENRTV